MLPRRERLTRADFSLFFESGTRYHSPLFTLVYHKQPSFHASVVVPKKIERSAVKRNKLRRRIYEILRNNHRRAATNGVFIILTKRPVTEASFAILQDEIEKIIGRTMKIS